MPLCLLVRHLRRFPYSTRQAEGSRQSSHARKGCVLAQAFSGSAIRSFEQHVLQHVESLVAYLTPADARAKKSKERSWSLNLDMAQLCKAPSVFA